MATNIDHKQGRIKDRGLWISAVIVGMFGSLLVMQGMTNTLLFVLISLSLIIIGKVSGKAFMRAVLLFSVVVAILFGIKAAPRQTPSPTRKSGNGADRTGSQDHHAARQHMGRPHGPLLRAIPHPAL